MSAYITEQEVWLQAYSNALSGGHTITMDRIRKYANDCADHAVEDFRKRYPAQLARDYQPKW